MSRVLVFTLDEKSFGLPVDQVDRVVRAVEIAPLSAAPACVAGCITVEGEAVPVFNMRQRLGFPEREIDLDDQMIIARVARRRVALPVDEAVDVSEFPGESLIPSGRSGGPDCICGNVEDGKGRMCVLDLNRFLSVDEEEMLDQTMNS